MTMTPVDTLKSPTSLVAYSFAKSARFLGSWPHSLFIPWVFIEKFDLFSFWICSLFFSFNNKTWLSSEICHRLFYLSTFSSWELNKACNVSILIRLDEHFCFTISRIACLIVYLGSYWGNFPYNTTPINFLLYIFCLPKWHHLFKQLISEVFLTMYVTVEVRHCLIVAFLISSLVFWTESGYFLIPIALNMVRVMWKKILSTQVDWKFYEAETVPAFPTLCF